MADDYRQIEWFKVAALTGGTNYMPTGKHHTLLDCKPSLCFSLEEPSMLVNDGLLVTCGGGNTVEMCAQVWGSGRGTWRITHR